jgi:hypothetical protein
MKELKVPVECYSRVVGYFRPLNQWNIGQQAQFHDRKTYIVPADLDSIQCKGEKREG